MQYGLKADHIEVFQRHANGVTIDAYCWAIVDKNGEVLCSLLDRYSLEGDYINTMISDGEMYFDNDPNWRQTVKIKAHVPEEYKSKEAKRLEKPDLEKILKLIRR